MKTTATSQPIVHYHYHYQAHWASPIFEHFKLSLKFQLWFHRVMCALWGCSMAGVLFFPPLYGHNLGILIVLEVSLYANFATEAGAIPATNAAISSHNVEVK